MKRWLKLIAWSLGSSAALAIIAAGVLVGLDRHHRRRAIHQIQSIPRGRFEKLAIEAQVLAENESAGWRVVPTSATPFEDLPAEYVAIDRHRVDLVFYKLWEDEVALYVYFDPTRIELVFPTKEGLRVEKVWPEAATQVAP